MRCTRYANDLVYYGLRVAFACLYTTLSNYHRYVDLPESNDQVHSVKCVSWIKSILLIIFMQWYFSNLCFQLTHLSFDDCENIGTSSRYHCQMGVMNHYPLLRVSSWHSGMGCTFGYVRTFDRKLMFKIPWLDHEQSVLDRIDDKNNGISPQASQCLFHGTQWFLLSVRLFGSLAHMILTLALIAQGCFNAAGSSSCPSKRNIDGCG